MAAVAGKTYPAVRMEIDPERVADFARAIGADPSDGVPPTVGRSTGVIQQFTVTVGTVMAVRGGAHVNGCENYFSILKRGINGVYQHVSPTHLKRYVGEFDFRYNNRIALGVDD